jgi:hypothetical protein
MALGAAALVALAAASGNFQMPVVAGDTRAGLSADGRTAVLIERPSGGHTRFAVVDTHKGRVVRVISLRGDYGFDATSADGARLYVIRYRSRDRREYAIQTLRTADDSARLRTVVEKGEPGERMSGLPITRVSSRDGGWVYTLYEGAGGHEPFIHALQTQQAFTVCIDLDALAGRPDLSRLKLALAGPVLSVKRSDGAPLARVNTESFDVTPVTATPAPRHAAQPPAKPAAHDTPDRTLLISGIAAATVAALGAILRARRKRKLSGVLRVNA